MRDAGANFDADSGYVPRAARSLRRHTFWQRLRSWPLRRLVNAVHYGYFVGVFLYRRLTRRAVVQRVYFAPSLPMRRHQIWKACMYLGAMPTRARTAEQTPSVYHTCDTAVPHYCPGLGRHAINYQCIDISKRRVQRVFAEVFGYELAVDPTTWRGPYVEKSNENAAHDGRVLTVPLTAPRPGRVYERLIDNGNGKGALCDLRTTIVGNRIPLVCECCRPETSPFKLGAISNRIIDVDCFSEEERRCLIEFARAMGLDYGELDVLRDRSDGRIYVVDANTTPTSCLDIIPIAKRIAQALQVELSARAHRGAAE